MELTETFPDYFYVMHSNAILPLRLPNDSSIEALRQPRSRDQQVASKRRAPATNQPMKRSHISDDQVIKLHR